MATLLKGVPVAKAISENMALHAQTLRANDIIPKLAILRVGEREDDISYERGALKRCENIGIDVVKFILPEDAKREEILGAIKDINEDKSIHGCLMFRPLKDREVEEEACRLLDPAKDVDGMTFGSLSTVYSGRGEGFAPCTAAACIELLKYYGYELAGKRVTVIGRSLVIGKPVSMMLQACNATVTMCHTKTIDLEKTCKEAEILVVAAGKARVVNASFVNPNQVVVDVGINVDDNNNLCGDVDFQSVEPIVSALTPVPGGVGSVTTAVLAAHVIEAAKRTAV